MKQGLLAFSLALITLPASAGLEQLVPGPTLQVLASEVSGVAAKRDLDTVTLYHRTRAGSQFHAAAEHIRQRLLEHGFEDAQILSYPADGETMFGSQKSRPAWDVDFAELWELDAQGNRAIRHGDWSAMPLSLAQDSVSGEVVTRLVDIGTGLSDDDYAGKDIRGALVLTDSQPEDVAERAVGELGAAGIVSYAPNQKTAWWKEDGRLVRWGHLDSFSPVKTFAFMVSLNTARAWQARLSGGETIRLDARVVARQYTGSYELVTATLPGADPVVGKDEIVYSCHLDHPRPGANDNASGCVSILEVARTLKRLVSDGHLPPPRRTLRFIWPAEIEGSLIWLESLEDTRHLVANIHLDMVGGGEVTKSVFRVSEGPMSLSSFQGDLAHEITRFVNAQTLAHASGDPSAFPLVSAEGSRNALLAQLEGIDLGSDHEVFNEGSYRIPGIYLHDWPDRYIHTNFDRAANIDPTKLKRAAFIAAVQGWALATLGPDQVEPLLELLRANALERTRHRMLKLASLDPAERPGAWAAHWQAERHRVDDLARFEAIPPQRLSAQDEWLGGLAALASPQVLPSVTIARDATIYRRSPQPRGPMHAFGYSYLEDHLGKAQAETLALDDTVAWEALSLVDGQRSVSDIRDWLQAEFGPVRLEELQAYFAALAGIGVLSAD